MMCRNQPKNKVDQRFLLAPVRQTRQVVGVRSPTTGLCSQTEFTHDLAQRKL
jgi:hypothetical protein